MGLAQRQALLREEPERKKPFDVAGFLSRFMPARAPEPEAPPTPRGGSWTPEPSMANMLWGSIVGDLLKGAGDVAGATARRVVDPIGGLLEGKSMDEIRRMAARPGEELAAKPTGGLGEDIGRFLPELLGISPRMTTTEELEAQGPLGALNALPMMQGAGVLPANLIGPNAKVLLDDISTASKKMASEGAPRAATALGDMFGQFRVTEGRPRRDLQGPRRVREVGEEGSYTVRRYQPPEPTRAEIQQWEMGAKAPKPAVVKQYTPEELRNLEFPVPEGGASKTPKTVFGWREHPEDMEFLSDLAKYPDEFRFNEVLGKGWEHEWPNSLALRDKIRRGEPITVYRASEEGGILPGAYVSESPVYVKRHGETRIPGGKFQVDRLQVYPDELMVYGDPHEFIYVPRNVQTAWERLPATTKGPPKPAAQAAEGAVNFTPTRVLEEVPYVVRGGGPVLSMRPIIRLNDRYYISSSSRAGITGKTDDYGHKAVYGIFDSETPVRFEGHDVAAHKVVKGGFTTQKEAIEYAQKNLAQMSKPAAKAAEGAAAEVPMITVRFGSSGRMYDKTISAFDAAGIPFKDELADMGHYPWRYGSMQDTPEARTLLKKYGGTVPRPGAGVPTPSPAKPAAPPVKPPVEPITAVGQPVYHGTGAVFEDFSEGSRGGLYGSAPYFTDNPVIASQYAETSRGRPNVRVEKLDIKHPFDTRKTLTLDELRGLPETPWNNPADYDLYTRRPIELPTGKEYFDSLAESFSGTGDTRTIYDQVGNLIDTGRARAADVIRDSGYDSIIYQGGELSGGTPHTVYVALDPKIIVKSKAARQEMLREPAAVEPGSPPVAPEGAAGGMPPIEPPAPPTGGMAATPPPKGLSEDNILGLRPIEPKAPGKVEDMLNGVRRLFRGKWDIVESHPAASAALEERRRVQPIIESMSTAFTEDTRLAASLFQRDKKGLIQSLAGVDPAIPTAPTLQHVAARLPLYEASLSPQQLTAMNKLRQSSQGYERMLRELGVEFGKRQDIIEGGFYLPRWKADLEGVEEPIKVFSGRAGTGRGSYRRGAEFETMPEGIVAGYEYPDVVDAVQTVSERMGRDALNAHVAGYFKTLRDDSRKLIGETSADRIAPEMRARVESLRQKISGRLDTLKRRTVKGKVLTEEEARRGKDVVRSAELRDKAGARPEPERTLSPSAEAQLQDELMNVQGRIAELEGTLTSYQGVQRPRWARGWTDDELIDLAQREGRNPYETDWGDRIDPILRKKEERVLAGRNLKRKGDIESEMRSLKAEEKRIYNALAVETATDTQIVALKRELRTLERELQYDVKRYGQAKERTKAILDKRQATMDEIQSFRDELDAISGDWNKAKEKARFTPRGQGVIALPGLEQWSFPDELANAVNSVVKREGAPAGSSSRMMEVVNVLNSGYRTLRATLDNSSMGIQSLLAWGSNPQAAMAATKVNLKAWWKGGEKALAVWKRDFDGRMTTEDMPLLQDWIRSGSQFGGIQTEFRSAALERIPGVRQANRAFGAMGDALRGEWNYNLLKEEMHRTGLGWRELQASGAMDEIATITNKMTGWTRKTGNSLLRDLGDFFLFAPRFLQARIETVVNGVAGMRPGAPVEQRIARQSLLKTLGFATLATTAINYMQGKETDYRPIVNGQWNPNFVRIRFGGRDYSLLGTYDSLARAIVLTATGKPQEALRGLGSGVLSIAWDLIGGADFSGQATRSDPGAFARYLLEELVPFAWQEIPDVAGQIGKGNVAAGTAALGAEMLGVKSAPMSKTDKMDELSLQMFGKEWRDLTAPQQYALRRSKGKEIAQIDKENKRPPAQSMDFTENYLAARNVKARLPEATRKKLEAIGVEIGPVSRVISYGTPGRTMDYRLKDKEFEAYQELLAKRLTTTLAATSATSSKALVERRIRATRGKALDVMKARLKIPTSSSARPPVRTNWLNDLMGRYGIQLQQ